MTSRIEKKRRKLAARREAQRRADEKAVREGKPRVVRGRGRLRDVSRKRILRAPRQRRTVKCIAYPNRATPRQWRAKDVGRIVCMLVNAAGHPDSRADLRAELEKCMPCSDPKDDRQPSGAIAQAVVAAHNALGDSLKTFAIGIAVVAGIIVLMRAIGIVLPAGLALVGGAGIRLALTRLTQLQAQFVAQQAANAETFALVRAAANSPFFKQVASRGF